MTLASKINRKGKFLWASVALVATIIAPSSYAQSPLSQADLAGRKLELWSIEKGSMIDQQSGNAYPFIEDIFEEMQAWKDSGKMPLPLQQQMGIQFKRWEAKNERGTRGNVKLLGMLLRDPDGKVSAAHLSFSTALRVTPDQGEIMATWPSRGRSVTDCLLSERMTGRVADRYLTVLPVTVPQDANTIKSLEGFAIVTPVKSHRFQFGMDALKSGERKTDGDVTIVPIEVKEEAGDVSVAFQIFRPLPAMKNSKPKNKKTKPSKQEQLEEAIAENIAARESGDVTSMSIFGKNYAGQEFPPNGSFSVSMARQFNSESAIKTEMKLRSKDGSDKANAMSADRKKSVGNIRVEASGYRFKGKDLAAVEIVFYRSTGMETIDQFEFRDVPLQTEVTRSSLHDHLSSLPVATSSVSPISSNTVRTWKDLSGKFAIEAELVLFDGNKVVLKKSDGKQVEVPLEKLSKPDRDFLDKL
jgi:hypothetical protein